MQHYILYLILASPGVYLREIVGEVSTVLGLDITERAVCEFQKKTGFTPHKLATYALQRDDTLNSMYLFIHVKYFFLWMKQVLTGKMQ